MLLDTPVAFLYLDLMKQSFLLALALGARLGFSIAIPLVILALGGRLLDRRYDTSPLFLLIGILLSLAASGYAVYREINKISETENKEK